MAAQDENLLDEIDGVLRDMPPMQTIRHSTPENHAWFGRAGAVIAAWDPIKWGLWQSYLDAAFPDTPALAHSAVAAVRKMHVMLHEARASVLRKVGGRRVISIEQGRPWEYFDETRKIIETARSDILFVDRYLEAEFVARYLPYVASGVLIRLLAREGIPKLRPAVDVFAQEAQSMIEIRSSQSIHERFVFVDGIVCYMSGDSFKQGAVGQPVTLSQITDAFEEVKAKYERLWAEGKLIRAATPTSGRE